jgi:hypothetical protein
MLHQPALVLPGKRIRFHEPFRQPDHPDLEAPTELQVGGGAHGNFDAAAPNINHDRGAASDGHSVGRGEMDEPGFFGAGDDPDLDPDLSGYLGNEIAAVLRLPDRAGRGGHDLVDLVRLREALELG